MRKILIIAAALIAAAPALAQTDKAEPQASIPFVNHGGVRDFDVVDNDTLYIEDQHRHWYRAELMGYCPDLGFARAIGFETRGPDTLDRFSTLIVRGQRCPVKSLVESGPPPKKAKKHS
ncbi:DUF6491 family protein [Sphingomonas sp.]|uniref:DUF6491 family protein n=1 Tax=Sphingomonas sp. TaxID=28214 RepID=UPI002DBE4F5D|nr:DUF6491 family protein [Sphingomonas sp.]HEU4967766.1 DUF6491 family protein [Sphingomonas sp.]